MVELLPFLVSGVLFGLVAGISPGPLLTLVLTETLQHGRKNGVLVAIAPVVTDIPIVLLSVLVLSQVSAFDSILGVISLLGGLFIAYLAYESLTATGSDLDWQADESQSLRKGIITNLLNPHPYVFWATVGAPTLLQAYSRHQAGPVAYILPFYLLLVGSKVGVAILVDRSKTFLTGHIYQLIIRALGFILIAFSVLFLRDGLKFLGLVG